MSKLSRFQREAVLDALRQWGELSMAADAAAVTTSYLKRVIAQEPELADEVEHARELHAASYVVMANETIKKDPLKAIPLIQSMLTARVHGFSPESRKKEAEKDKPTALRLRTFDSEGKETQTQVLQLEHRRIF